MGVLLPRVRKIYAGRLKGWIATKVATTKWEILDFIDKCVYIYVYIWFKKRKLDVYLTFPEIKFEEDFIELGIVWKKKDTV